MKEDISKKRISDICLCGLVKYYKLSKNGNSVTLSDLLPVELYENRYPIYGFIYIIDTLNIKLKIADYPKDSFIDYLNLILPKNHDQERDRYFFESNSSYLTTDEVTKKVTDVKIFLEDLSFINAKSIFTHPDYFDLKYLFSCTRLEPLDKVNMSKLRKYLDSYTESFINDDLTIGSFNVLKYEKQISSLKDYIIKNGYVSEFGNKFIFKNSILESSSILLMHTLLSLEFTEDLHIEGMKYFIEEPWDEYDLYPQYERFISYTISINLFESSQLFKTDVVNINDQVKFSSFDKSTGIVSFSNEKSFKIGTKGKNKSYNDPNILCQILTSEVNLGEWVTENDILSFFEQITGDPINIKRKVETVCRTINRSDKEFSDIIEKATDIYGDKYRINNKYLML